MKEILYYIFIFPLEQVLDWILLIIYTSTKNYGVSIILLSLLINLFLLKISLYTDSRAKQESLLKSKLDKRIKNWKKVYSRAKTYAFTQTLYRQHRYNPIYALRSLGGLALQIPFFIAILQLVENMEVLDGVSFLWIKDLSRPDSINFLNSIHLMPIIMTILTLINVFYSSKEIGARIQGSLIAIFFLIILYDMPSALVLYWSCNMAFSLTKEVVKKKFNTSISTIENNIKSKLKKTITHIYESKHYATNNSKLNNVFAFMKSLFVKFFPTHNILDFKTYINYRDISIYATLNIFFIVCVFTPYAIYSSDTSEFDLNQTYQTFGSLFGFFMLCSLGFIYIISFFYKTRLLKIIAYSLSAFLMLGVIYTFVFIGDYGPMNNFVLQKPNFPNTHTLQQYVIVFGMILCFLIATHLFINYIKRVYVILFTTLCMLSAFYFFISIDSVNKAKSSISQNDADSTDNYDSEIFSYSKTNKNIVVLLLDMFSGSHMLPILEQFPDFKHKFDGFTLFSNAVSTTNATLHSTATIIGGEYYAVYNMNSRNDLLREGVASAFGIMGDTFIKNGYEVGYIHSGIYDANMVKSYNPKIFIEQNYKLGLNKFLEINPKIKDSFDNSVKYSVTDIRWRLLNVGIFRFFPEVYRHKIYRNGRWYLHAARVQRGGGELFVVTASSLLYALTHFTNANATKPTFKFLHFNMTHVPYGIYYNNGKCEFYSQKSAWNEYPHKSQMSYTIDSHKWEYYQHYDTEVCALSYINDFILWLKKEGIYDNTQIFIVSDHSGRDSINIPKRIQDAWANPDTIFLFKDFNTRGELKQDTRLMVNYDIPSIFCYNIPNGCPNVPKNILQNYPKNRAIISTLPPQWNFERHEKNHWTINKYYLVKDNIYEDKNWHDITNEVENGTLNIIGNH